LTSKVVCIIPSELLNRYFYRLNLFFTDQPPATTKQSTPTVAATTAVASTKAPTTAATTAIASTKTTTAASVSTAASSSKSATTSATTKTSAANSTRSGQTQVAGVFASMFLASILMWGLSL
jgi:cytoskeletal protein RodZ